MKQVHPNYTFVASTKTITLTGLNIAQDQLLLITNATRGVIYYNFASSSHRAEVTAGANTTVVLADASTTGHANEDQLVIHYDDQLSTQAIAGTVTANVPMVPNQPASQTQAIPVVLITDEGKSVFDVNQSLPVYGTVTIGSLPAVTANAGTGTFAVSAASLPLPSGAATSANQTTANTSLSNIDTDIGALADSAATTDTGSFSLIGLFKRLLQRITALIPSNLTVTSTRLLVDGSGVTQPISGTVTANGGDFTYIDATGFGGGSKAVLVAGRDQTNEEIKVIPLTSGGASVIAEVSGTVTANLAPQASGPIIQVDSAIPSDPKYATIVGGFDTGAGESRALRLGSNGEMIVQDPALIAKSGGSVSDSVQNIQVIGGRTGGGGGSSSYAPASIDGNGGLQVGVKWIDTNSGNQTRDPSQQTPFPVQIISATSLPLPSGAATSASQATANTSLSSIDSKLPTLSSGRVPVVAGNLNGTIENYDTDGTATHKVAVQIYDPNGQALGGGAPLPISGTVTANVGSVLGFTEIYLADADNDTRFSSSYPFPVAGTVTANTLALQGTAVTTSNFTSTTASTVLANYNATRKVLTIFNEGAGNLHICAGATCTTIAYQVRLSAGDYYEVPNHQTTITHSAVFATAGTARVTEVS